MNDLDNVLYEIAAMRLRQVNYLKSYQVYHAI